MKQVFENADKKMNKTINALTPSEFAGFRAGGPNRGGVEKIRGYFGAPPLKNPCRFFLQAPPPHPLYSMGWWGGWKGNTIPLIWGVTHRQTGRVRLIFPPLTEDRRRDIVKDIKKMEEEAKVAIRSIRRDSMDKLKALKKNGEITEDDLKDAEKKMQNQTDKFIKGDRVDFTGKRKRNYGNLR